MTKNIQDYKLCFVRTLDGDNAHVLFFTPFDARNVTGMIGTTHLMSIMRVNLTMQN